MAVINIVSNKTLDIHIDYILNIIIQLKIGFNKVFLEYQGDSIDECIYKMLEQNDYNNISGKIVDFVILQREYVIYENNKIMLNKNIIQDSEIQSKVCNSINEMKLKKAEYILNNKKVGEEQ